MAYPDWVLKHKVKGTYINCVGGKYYLYAAHSERIPGTKKVKRVSDGYLGRITEQDGLIPSKDKVLSDIMVYEYGLSCAILQLCENIYKGFKRTSPKSADHIMVSSILNVIYGSSNSISFKKSYLSVLFPSLNIEKPSIDHVLTNISRGSAMIKDYLHKLLDEKLTEIFDSLSGLYKVKVNDKWYLSKEDEQVLVIKEKYQLRWEK
jgi:hypothetical protein